MAGSKEEQRPSYGLIFDKVLRTLKMKDFNSAEEGDFPCKL